MINRIKIIALNVLFNFQAEIYKADFNAERKAREDQNLEKIRLEEEVVILRNRNEQLISELQALSESQVSGELFVNGRQVVFCASR